MIWPGHAWKLTLESWRIIVAHVLLPQEGGWVPVAAGPG
jgi:hypothetical protein